MVEKLIQNYDSNAGDGILNKYLKDIYKEPTLTAEEERELIEKIYKGDEKAREKLLRTHLKLVVSIAKRFTGYSIPLIDLISEGNIGLMKAIEKFDLDKGVRFATYASWWIKQSIKRAILNNSKIIRMPVHAVDILRSFIKTLKAKESENNNAVHRKSAAKKIGMDIDKVEDLMIVSQDVLSYNQTLSDDSSNSFEEVLLSDESTPLDSCERKEIIERIINWLTCLNEKERTVLILRFGLINQHPMTLEEVGNILKLTKERIRQIEEKALNKLRFYLKKHRKEFTGG